MTWKGLILKYNKWIIENIFAVPCVYGFYSKKFGKYNLDVKIIILVVYILQPVDIVKRCVRSGVASCQVRWEIMARTLSVGTPETITTDEPLHLILKSLPQLLEEFEEKINALRKGMVTDACCLCYWLRAVLEIITVKFYIIMSLR